MDRKAKSTRLEVRITPSQRTDYDKARGDIPLSVWVRKVLEKEVDTKKGNLEMKPIETRDEARELYDVLVKYLRIYSPETILDFVRRANNDIGRPKGELGRPLEGPTP